MAGRVPEARETWTLGSIELSAGSYRSFKSLDGPATSIWVHAGSDTIVVVRGGRPVWPSSGLPHFGKADVMLPWRQGFETFKRQALEGQLEVHSRQGPMRALPQFSGSSQLLGPEAGGLLVFDLGVIWKLTGL